MELTVVLDTNAYSDWRRAGRWHQWISKADSVLLPATVLGELFHGFRKGSDFAKNAFSLDAFLAEPQVDLLPVGRLTAEIYGEFVSQLQKQGTPIPTNDIWIAAATHEVRGLLLTRDAHFKHLPQLRVAEANDA